MSKKAKVVVAYLRLSREDGNDESTSISNQRRIILEYAEKNNMLLTISKQLQCKFTKNISYNFLQKRRLIWLQIITFNTMF